MIKDALRTCSRCTEPPVVRLQYRSAIVPERVLVDELACARHRVIEEQRLARGPSMATPHWLPLPKA